MEKKKIIALGENFSDWNYHQLKSLHVSVDFYSFILIYRLKK